MMNILIGFRFTWDKDFLINRKLMNEVLIPSDLNF